MHIDTGSSKQLTFFARKATYRDKERIRVPVARNGCKTAPPSIPRVEKATTIRVEVRNERQVERRRVSRA